MWIGLYLILALSLNLINGCGGMFSLGHQGFWAVGAYGAAALIVKLPFDLPGPVVFALSLVVGALCATLAGLIIGVPCLRLRGDYLAVATLGFAEIIRNLLIKLDWLGASRGQRIPPQVLDPQDTGAYQAFYLTITWLFVVVTIWICRNVIHSSHGRAILAIREDEVAAELLGVNVTRYKLLVFLLGSMLAGLAGALHANFELYIAPPMFAMLPGIMILLMVVLGGAGSMSGTAIAVFVLYTLQQVLKLGLFGLPTSAASAIGWAPLESLAKSFELLARERWQAMFAILLVIVMISMPQGIFGKRELWQMDWFRRFASWFGFRARHDAGSAA